MAKKVRVKIDSIELRLAEGRIGRLGLVKIDAGPFEGRMIAFRMADAVIKVWAKDTDKHTLGYRKLDFILKWSDGETYSGTFLLQPKHARGSGHLAKHVRGYLKIIVGMDEKGLSRASPETVRMAKKVLKSYQLS